MEFDGFGALKPLYSASSEEDNRPQREIEGGWFLSGPAVAEEIEALREINEKEKEQERKGFKKKVRANALVHRMRQKILQREADKFTGKDPQEILNQLKATKPTKSTKMALTQMMLLDTKIDSSLRSSITSKHSKQSILPSLRKSKQSILPSVRSKPSMLSSAPHRLVNFRTRDSMKSSRLSGQAGKEGVVTIDVDALINDGNVSKGSGRNLSKAGSTASKMTSSAISMTQRWAPLMSKQDVARYRNSIAQNVCQDLLIKGFHRAYAEIFNMMRRNREARDASDPDSPVRHMSLLEHSPRKLEKIKKGLEEIEEIERSYRFHRYKFLELEASMLAGTELPRTDIDLDYEDNVEVESATPPDSEPERQSGDNAGPPSGLETPGLGVSSRPSSKSVGGSVWHRQFTLKGQKHPYMRIFEQRYNLGIYFNSIDDFWISHYFFETAVEMAVKIPGTESGPKLAECNRAFGRSLENNGFYLEAAKRMEDYLRLTKENKYCSEDGRSLEKDAYIQLSRIYNSIANQMIKRTRDIVGEKNPKDEALNYFHKSYTVAYKAGDRTIESLASYKLGLMLLYCGHPKKCLKYLEVYLYYCETNGNEYGAARALEGIARALHEMGDNFLVMGYLAKFDDIITRKRKEALKALAASQWRCDNVLKFIESVRYQILEGSFIRCSRLIGAIYDDKHEYEKAEPFLQNSYQVAKRLRDNDEDRYKCSRTQYGIAVAHRLWDDLAQTFEHNDWDVKKKLANAKMMLNWRLNRITGFCRPEDNIQPEDVDWTLDLEMLEQGDGQSYHTPSTNPEKMLEGARSTTVSKRSTFDSASEFVKSATSVVAGKKTDSRSELIAKAQFNAIERTRSTRALKASRSTLLTKKTDWTDKQSSLTSDDKAPQPPVGVEGPKLPVREKARERWSGVELVPQWWMELDINFVNEYGLLGNCMRAGFHPFFSAREQTFGKVQTAPAAKSRAEFSGEFSEELSTYSGTRESSGEKLSGGAEADPEEDPGANLAVGHPHHEDDRDPDDDHNRQSHYDHDHPNHDNDHNQDDEQNHDRRDDDDGL